MRIISEFHDYYDTVQAFVQDDSIIYNRKTETEICHLSRIFPLWQDVSYNRFNVNFSIIGFCGQTYKKAHISQYSWERDEYTGSFVEINKSVDIFSMEEAIEYVSDLKIKKQGTRRDIKSSALGEIRDFWGNGRNRWYKDNSPVESNFDKYFEKAPIWIASRGYSYGKNPDDKITYNPMLKDTGFVKIKNPFDAHQELDMWFSNKGQPLKPIPDISDKDMRDIKGFDNFSFKKPPSEKK